MTTLLRALCWGTTALTTLIAGCASTTRVVLLPQENLADTAVEVRPLGAGPHTPPTVLNAPYAAADVRGSHSADTLQLDAREVQSRYATLLAAQPKLPERFTLYFELGTTDLTPESHTALDHVLARATSWSGSDIVITGHTDRVGSTESNDLLSIKRAMVVRDMVLARKFDPLRVEATGRGERELLIPTEDNVPETRNRRVEIIVR